MTRVLFYSSSGQFPQKIIPQTSAQRVRAERPEPWEAGGMKAGPSAHSVAAVAFSQRSGACHSLALSRSKCLQFRVSVIQHVQRIRLFSTVELKEGQLPVCLGWWKTSGKLPLHTQGYLLTPGLLAPPILETAWFFGTNERACYRHPLLAVTFWLFHI